MAAAEETEQKSSQMETRNTRMLSFRCKIELYDQLPATDKARFINQALEQAFTKPKPKERDALIFLFNLFQKNASRLKITDDEREKAKKILEMLQNG